MGKLHNLQPKSIETLKPLITFWSTVELDLNADINSSLDIETTGVNRYIAQHVIFYAVLLGDVELARDLCENGADLTKTDPWHFNKNPLELAIEYGRASVAGVLIEFGATANKNVRVPSTNPCKYPSTFFWALKERFDNREVDFQSINKLLHSNKYR